MTTYTMHRAHRDDIDTVMGLVEARIEWLQQRGTNQWTTREQRPLIERSIDHGETWIMSTGGTAVATLTMTTVADADFWTVEEINTPALYLSKLATQPASSGQGLGALMVDWATTYAADRGVSTIRWDVWRTNRSLQRYYSRIGADHLRTEHIPGRLSGALYQVSYQQPAADLNQLITTDARIGLLAELDSKMITGYDLGPDDFAEDDQTRPDHHHVVTGLYTPPLATPTPQEPTELTIDSSSATPVVLYDPGPGWRAKRFYSHQITRWDSMPDLQTGQLYQIRHDTATDGTCRIVLSGDV